jgi:TonB-dependent receptor-like protein
LRIAIRALLVSALLSGAAASASAQQPVPMRPPDSLRADSLRADSLRRADTLSTTDRLLQVQGQKLVHLDPLPACGANTLQTRSGRLVFDRDSIDWAAAESVGELLARVPGVFTQRSDWIGSPESPVYFGLGAASVEYVQDCVPMAPIGPDSVAINPAIIPLNILDRIEVERSPGLLRVFLFTRRHDRQAPRTKIGASQGDRGATRYFGSYERRYTSGIGLSLGADYVGLNAVGNGSGGGNIPTAWIQLGYVPSARIGIQAQLITHLISQNTLVGDDKADTLLQSMKGTRTDEQLRAAWRQRTNGLGSSIDLIAARTSWASDTAPGPQSVAQFGLILGRREPTWSAQWATWHYSRVTALDSRLDLGWAPFDRLSGSVELVAQQHDNHRSSDWATGRIGIKLPLGFTVGGMVSDGHRVQTPFVTNDVAQQFKDAEVTAGFGTRLLSLDAGYTRNDGWRPRAFQEFVAIAGLAPLAQTNWLTMHARLAPVSFLTFESLYQNPLAGALPDGTPPSHFLTTATLRSRFLRNFPSGIFGLKLQVSMENWSAGIGGRDSLGTAIPLAAATYFRAIIQFQLGPFIAYYDRINLKADRGGYVPGYVVQPLGSTFGIRWEFSN